MKTLTPSLVWRISPALLVALDEHLGAPVDSYLNGTQAWLTPEPTAVPDPTVGITLEWRLHPPAGFRIPNGCTHHDLWDEAQAGVAGLAAESPGAAAPSDAAGDAQSVITVGDEQRALASLWEGLECFPAYGDEIEPAALGARAADLLPVAATASGLVDHGRIGSAWEKSGGKSSLVAMLLDELGVSG